jgi:hypothetical protein
MADSEEDDGFAKQGGDALDIGDEFDSEEEQDQSDDNAPMPMPQQKPAQPHPASKPAAASGAVKGEKVENQPFDLAVEVNDSEEIESDEEDDEVNVDAVQQQ